MKRARKKNKIKNDNNNIPADKDTVCSEKRIQFCNFSSIFQTLLNSNFIDAVYTSEILFSPKIFAKIQVLVIRKCGLYTPVYGTTPVLLVEISCFQSRIIDEILMCNCTPGFGHFSLI